MNVLFRQYRLSSEKGEGIHCDAGGAFVGSEPLLKWSNGTWKVQDNGELSDRLSALYRVPVDFAEKSGALCAVARALNDGDIARAQLIALHMQLPEPPPLAKSAFSQDELGVLAGLLEYAGVLKINNRHYPAGTPDSKGGQFAPKDGNDSPTTEADKQDQIDPTDNLNPFDDPTRDASRSADVEGEAAGEQTLQGEIETAAEAEERAAQRATVRAAVREAALSTERAELRVAARRAFREAAVEALQRIGAKLVLNEIPIVGVVADLATVYDVYRFVREFSELRAAIKAATRFVNEGTHTLAQLRVSSESLSFRNYEAFVKVWDAMLAQMDLEKRFGPARQGFEYHHIIERNSGEASSIIESTDNIVEIPTILHEEITARYTQSQARFGGQTLRQWLRTQPAYVKRYWGRRILKEVGIIVGE